MEWISSEHFKLMSDTAFISFVQPFITVDLGNLADKRNDIILLFKNQISYAKQLNDLITKTFFVETKFKDFKKKFEFISSEDSIKMIKMFAKKIQSLQNWNIDNILQTIDFIKKETKRSGKELFMPIRIFTSHNEHGPELGKIIYIIGKEKVLGNINSFLKEM